MAIGKGTVDFDFGAPPGKLTTTVTGVVATGMSATSYFQIEIDGTDSNADHNAYAHRFLKALGWVALPTAKNAGSFDAEAVSPVTLTGIIRARFIFAD